MNGGPQDHPHNLLWPPTEMTSLYIFRTPGISIIVRSRVWRHNLIFTDYKLELISAHWRVVGFSEQLFTIDEWCLHSVTLVACFFLAQWGVEGWGVMNPLWAWPLYVPYTSALYLLLAFTATLKASLSSSFSVVFQILHLLNHEHSGWFLIPFAALLPLNGY